VVGPFLADGKNNDASIAKNIFMNNEEDILGWLEDDDIVVVDRGFRDALTTINNFGFRVQMPDFLNGKKQLSAREANNSRCVTKVRWIIEGGMNETNLTLVSMFHFFFFILSVNAKIKQWRYFSQTIQNSNISRVGSYLSIICALINAYRETNTINTVIGREWAQQMRILRDKENRLQRRLEQMNSGDRKPQWKKYDAQLVIFPTLSEQDVRNICFGNYSCVSLTKYSFNNEHR
jgi:hypothetical protein